jgi:hypothetical protein
MEVRDEMGCAQDIGWIDEAKCPWTGMELELKLVFGCKPSTSLLVNVVPTDPQKLNPV